MAFQFTDSNTAEIIASGQPVMIDVWATWCGPCKAMAPMIDELAKEYEGRVLIGKYNCDEEDDFISNLDTPVRGLPSFLFFKNGKAADFRLAGSQSRESLVQALDKLLAL